MNQKKLIRIIGIVVLVVIIAGVIYFIYNKRQINNNLAPIKNTELGTPKYSNIEYGFSFSLPTSWIGYLIVVKNWEGSMLDNPASKKITGPEILIRHPLWTAANPRQDIPIMVFTLAEWDLVKQEKVSLGAAPIGPSELGRNATYVFGLPARYNFAYLSGFEEVEKIIQDKSFQAF